MLRICTEHAKQWDEDGIILLPDEITTDTDECRECHPPAE